MTRLVKRHLGGGWMAAIDAAGKVGSSIGDLIRQREHDKKQKEIAAMNMQQAQAEQQTAEWRAKAAMAAGQFDRNGEGSVTAAINNGMRVIPYTGAMAPNYYPAAQPQTNPSVVNSGMLSGVVNSFFKNNNSDDDEDEAYSGIPQEDQDPNMRRKNNAQWRAEQLKKESKDNSSTGNAVDQTLSGDIQTNTEEKPPITEKAQSSVETKPVGAGGNLGSDTESAKREEKKNSSLSLKTQSAECGCKLKKRFNPRQFKKQK